MKTTRNLLILLVLGLNLTSCLMIDSTRTMNIEIMKPGIFTMPENIRSVAIINRDINESDSVLFVRFNETKLVSDVLIKHSSLSNKCVDALSDFLKEEKYFNEVRNLRDSSVFIFSPETNTVNQEDFFKKIKADLCIILNHCEYFVSDYSNMVENKAALSWTLAMKDDSLSYWYDQKDTLNFEDFDYQLSAHKRVVDVLNNSSSYLGRSFGAKIIPTWLNVERIYYKSNNPEMIKAEKLALNNEWLKAADIWNKLSKNKNAKIAAKASFNMALACEMEGKVGVAIDWLVRSYSGLTFSEKEHQANCQHYINVLALRRKEIDKLEKQVRMQ